jgi:hypothetical protein
MLLEFIQLLDRDFDITTVEYNDLLEKYKAEGIIKKFNYNSYNEEFEWI